MRFDRVDEATAQWLQRETGLAGEASRLRTSAAFPYGHFRLLSAGGNRFLKVLGCEDAQRHRLADGIARCGWAGGADVVPPGAWIETADGTWIGVYPYIEGRYGEATAEDAARLGTAVAVLHRAFRTSERAGEVRRASAGRMRMLARRRLEILDGRGPMGPDAAELQALLRSMNEPFSEPMDGQIIHGDLNLGNVLFDVETGLPTIIDFETATVSWLSPRVDVAMAIQRLCLVASCRDDDKIPAVRALLTAYADVSGEAPFISLAQLVEALRWISLRNLCLLAEIENQGRGVLLSEWQKFLLLGVDAENSASCLKPLFASHS